MTENQLAQREWMRFAVGGNDVFADVLLVGTRPVLRKDIEMLIKHLELSLNCYPEEKQDKETEREQML